MSELPGTPNETARIEAFSDGVFAIAITLLILEIRVPPQTADGSLRAALRDLWPSYIAFLASFMTIGIMYAVLVAIAFFSVEWCLTLSILYALYFALPPSLWRRGAA